MQRHPAFLAVLLIPERDRIGSCDIQLQDKHAVLKCRFSRRPGRTQRFDNYHQIEEGSVRILRT